MRYNLLLALALVLATACSKKEKKADDAVPTPTKEIVATGALDKLAAPAGVIGFGGSDSPEALVKAFASAMGPAGAMVSAANLAMGIEQSYHLPSGSLDLARPMRVVIADPKAHKEPLAVAAAVKDRAALEKSLAGKKADGGYALDGAFAGFVEDYVLLAHDKDLLAKQRDFFRQALGAKVAAPATFVLSVANVDQVYGKEFEANLQMLQHLPRSGMAGGDPQQMEALAQMAGGVLRGAGTLTANLTTPEGDLVLTVDGRAKDGSDLGKDLGGPGKLSLLAKLPKDASFGGAASIDVDHPSAMMKQLMQLSFKLGFGEASDKMETYLKAFTGEFGFAGYRQPGSDNATIVMISGVRDAAGVKAYWDEMAKRYKDPAIAERLKKTGMSIDIKPDAYKVGKVPVRVQEMKLDAKAAPQLAQMQAMLGALGTTHMAVDGDVAVVAIGKDAKPAMEAWLSGKAAGGLDQAAGVVRARKHAADDAFFLAYAPLGSLMSFLPVPGAAQLASSLKSDSGLAVSLGAKDGALRLVVDLPAEQLQQAFAAVSALKGGRR